MAPLHAVATSSLFSGLTFEQCEPFAPLARERGVRKGHYLFRLGEPALTVLIIRRGVVHLLMPLAIKGGEREVVVQETNAGETIAWSALVAPFRYTMSARTATDVDLIEFAGDGLRRAAEAHPDAGTRLFANLASVVGRRLQVVQAMWTRELQHSLDAMFG